MNYPLISEYVEAIKSAEDDFATLINLRPVLDGDGNPVMTSGNFAVVFKMRDEENGKLYAVKCFLKDQPNRAESYKMIADELEYVSSTFLVQFRYLDKELFVDTNNSDEDEFPVLLMDWVEGVALDAYIINNKYDGFKIYSITNNFFKLSKWLLSQPFAHGDLKPDNILVKENGEIILIDYDGMYVPQMFGQEPREQGSPDFRNPANHNSFMNKFNKRIDEFAIIQILLSLRIYSLYPQFINKNESFAFFTNEDFPCLTLSKRYMDLMSYKVDNGISILIAILQKCIVYGKIEKEDWRLLNFYEEKNSYVDLRKAICNLDNITLSVNLAYSAMYYKDPDRNEYEINWYRNPTDRINLAIEMQDFLKNKEWPYAFERGIKYARLKSNGIECREGVVLNLTEYALRYLFGLIKYKNITKNFPSNVFGGLQDVFIKSKNEYKYESNLDEFVRTQEVYSKQYKYLYVFDIRNFFKNVNLTKMKDFFFGNGFKNVDWYVDLFDQLFLSINLQGLDPCSEVDFFFANLYLQPLDNLLSHNDDIKYLRYCDDIRIFSNDNNLLDYLQKSIIHVLSNLSLSLNQEKTKQIDTIVDSKALAIACYVWSGSLYLGVNQDNSKLLSGKNLKEIIDDDLTTTYVFKLINEIDNCAQITYWNYSSHIDSLFYVLKHVHKNATFYRVVSELIFDVGMRPEDETVFAYILKMTVVLLRNENVESFVKYWVLRTFFCNEKDYYKWYLDQENTWGGQEWYPQHGYFEQIKNLLFFFRSGGDELLGHLSDYILSVIDPFNN